MTELIVAYLLLSLSDRGPNNARLFIARGALLVLLFIVPRGLAPSPTKEHGWSPFPEVVLQI